MPTISVDKADLWERLGQEYCAHLIQIMFPTWFQVEAIATEDFDKLCFEYGLEIDEDVLFFCLDKATQQHADIFWFRPRKKSNKLSRKDCLQNVRYDHDVILNPFMSYSRCLCHW